MKKFNQLVVNDHRKEIDMNSHEKILTNWFNILKIGEIIFYTKLANTSLGEKS